MWVDSSNSSSLLSRHLCPSNSSFIAPHIFLCFESKIVSATFTAFTVTNVFLLPLYILILWTGFRQWRHRCSVTHTDVFTYYMVAIEIIGVLGMVFFCCAVYTCSEGMMLFGYYSLSLTYPGQTFFHLLTCLERYLAVVHPITYLGLRSARGVKVRNISNGCVLALCGATTGFTVYSFPDFPTSLFNVLVAISSVVIFFCSISALGVLLRLGLWKVGGAREQIDQSKRRAFHTIMVIMGTLVLRICALTISNLMFNLLSGIRRNNCILLISIMWLSLPSCLVLPLLFLHRARRLNASEN